MTRSLWRHFGFGFTEPPSVAQIAPADLDGASFKESRLFYTNLKDISARAADFSGAVIIHPDDEDLLHRTDFRGSIFRAAYIVDWHPEYKHTELSDFSGVSFFLGPRPHFDTPVNLEGAAVRKISQAQLEEWLKGLDPLDRAAVTLKAEKMEAVDLGEFVEWDEKAYQALQPQIQASLAELACGKDGGTAMALGLVRRIKLRRRFDDLMAEANARVGFGDGNPEVLFWQDLERRLTSAKCEVTLKSVKRALAAW